MALWDKVKSFGKDVKKGFLDEKNELKQEVGDAAKKVSTPVRNQINKAVDELKTVNSEEIKKGLEDGKSELKQDLEGAKEKIKTSMEQGLDDALGDVLKVIETAKKEGGKPLVHDVHRGMADASAEMREMEDEVRNLGRTPFGRPTIQEERQALADREDAQGLKDLQDSWEKLSPEQRADVEQYFKDNPQEVQASPEMQRLAEACGIGQENPEVKQEKSPLDAAPNFATMPADQIQGYAEEGRMEMDAEEPDKTRSTPNRGPELDEGMSR